MSDVPVWHGYAYMGGEPDFRDVSRALADWQVEGWVRWAKARGFDSIYLYRTRETVEYQAAPPVDGVRHEWAGLAAPDEPDQREQHHDAQDDSGRPGDHVEQGEQQGGE